MIELSPETEMIGYPEFMQERIRIRTLFSPIFHGLQPGKTVRVESQLQSADGQWAAYQVGYNLASETSGGPWEMTITAAPAARG